MIRVVVGIYRRLEGLHRRQMIRRAGPNDLLLLGKHHILMEEIVRLGGGGGRRSV